jgi:hypothetical protein
VRRRLLHAGATPRGRLERAAADERRGERASEGSEVSVKGIVDVHGLARSRLA